MKTDDEKHTQPNGTVQFRYETVHTFIRIKNANFPCAL